MNSYISNRRALLSAAVAAPVLPLLAGIAHAAKSAVFTDGGVAIRGYDPVAYFTQSAPVAGDAAYRAAYNGATWLFASAENQALFEAQPEAFAPQYGGYCAYAVSKGGTVTTSPDAWTIVDDKLYLNFNKVVRGIWSNDIPGNIAKADANWPSVLA